MDFRAYFQTHRDEIVEELKSLVRIPSVRAAAEPGAPFGKECLAALQASVALFAKHGFSGAIDESGTYALVKAGEGEEKDAVGLFAHTDVVPVGDGWTYAAPFDPVEVNGSLIGRGVGDNKAGVLMSLWALCALRESGEKLSRPLLVFLGANEESGMKDIKECLRTHTPPAVNLVPDGGYPIGIGEKGIARFWLTSTQKCKDVLTFEGGKAHNVVLDDVLCETTFPCENLPENIVSLSPCRIRAKGIARHASRPEGSRNAAGLAAAYLAGVLPDKSERDLFAAAAKFLSSSDGAPFGIAASDPHFTSLTCVNGEAEIQDGCLRLSFDIRYGTATDGKEMRQKVEKAAADAGFGVSWISQSDGFCLDPDAPEVRTVLAVCQKYSGKEETPNYMSGGTYARYLPNAFSTATRVPYLPAAFPLPEGHGGAHSADERLPIDAFLEQCAIMADAISRLAK